MENAKHIGGMTALAVALGVGMAVAAAPAVAWAAPGDSDKGSTHESDSASSDTSPQKKATGTETRKHRGSDFHPAALNTTPKKAPKPAVVNTTLVKTSDVPASARAATPKRPVNPVTQLVSTAVNALAFSRREFEQAFTVPSARKTTVANTSRVTPALVDPSFISSTHGFFGLFSVTSAADPADNNYVAFVLRTPFFTDVLTSGRDPEDNLGLGAASIGVAGHTVNTFISPFGNFTLGIPITDPLAPLFTALVRAGF